MNFQLWKSNSFRYSAIGLVLIWLIIHLCFIAFYGNSILQYDMWRHAATILIPFINGEGWQVLFDNHHAIPLVHIHQLTNYFVFGGNLKLDAYLSMLIWFVIGFWFLYYFSKSFNSSYSKLSYSLFALLGFTTCVTTGAGWQYTLPLVPIQSYFFIVGLGLIWITNSYLINNENYLKYWIGIILVAIISILFHENYGVSFLFASAGLLVFQFLYHRQYKFLLLAALLILGGLSYKLILAQGTNLAEAPIRREFLKVYFSLDFCKLVLETTGRGLINGFFGNAPKVETILLSWIYIVSGFIFLLSTTLFVLNSKSDRFITGILMFVFVIIASASLMRWWAPGAFGAPRYIFTHKLMAISMVWIIYHASKTRKIPQQFDALVSLFFVFIMIGQLFTSLYGINHNPRDYTLHQDRELSVAMLGLDEGNDFTPVGLIGIDSWASESDYPYVSEVIAFLKEHKLNQFNPNYHDRDQILEYKQAFHAFQNYDIEQLSNVQFSTECFEIEALTTKRYWTLQVTAKKKIQKLTVTAIPSLDEMRFPVYTGQMNHYGVLQANQAYEFCLPDKLIYASFKVLEVAQD